MNSNIKFLEKLLQGVEVEWKTLGEVAKIGTGSHDTKDAIENGKYTFYARGVAPLSLNIYDFDETAIITAGDGVGVGKVFHWAVGKYALHQRAYRIVPNEKESYPRYVYHYIVANFYSYIEKTSVSSSVTSMRKPMFLKFPIPIPPLTVQKEIVRILDSFSAFTSKLTVELTAELTARKQQYNYYREQLLSFEGGEVEWKTLGSLAKFTYGYAAKAQKLGSARFIRISDISIDGKLIQNDEMYVDVVEESKRYLLKKNDIVMARTGASFGKTMIFEDDFPAIYAGFLIKISFDENTLLPKYYWHFAQSSLFRFQAHKLVSGGGQPQFNANALKDVKIPIPYPNNPEKSISEQYKVVKLLDKFDILTTSISEGLPKEIELRKKQYEYYRDLLLTFPLSESGFTRLKDDRIKG